MDTDQVNDLVADAQDTVDDVTQDADEGIGGLPEVAGKVDDLTDDVGQVVTELLG